MAFADQSLLTAQLRDTSNPSAIAPITPPITPCSDPLILPPLKPDQPDNPRASPGAHQIDMAAVQGATPFQVHLLSLLSNLNQEPSPSYPFPHGSEQHAWLSPFVGEKTPAEAAIERGLLALTGRLGSSAAGGQGTVGDGPGSKEDPKPRGTNLLTPEWTPPVGDADIDHPPCPTCTRGYTSASSSYTTDSPSGAFPSAGSHPLSMSLSTPATQLSSYRSMNPNMSLMPHSILTTPSGASVLTGGPGAASWGTSRIGESGMTAEKELELLKAQVQDIARVCKVSLLSCIPYNGLMNGSGRRYWRLDAKDHCSRRGSGYDRIEGYHQLHGRPTQDLCSRGRAGITRSRNTGVSP
jgi:hypothetical protein